MIIPTLKSIENQVGFNSRDEIEVLLVHGDSIPSRPIIHANLNLRQLENPKQNAIWGKYLGILNAKHEYLVFLDHDEVLMSPDSLIRKLGVFEKNKDVKMIFTSGYHLTRNESAANIYASVYGDPVNYY